jgi:hypothetical protein
MQGRIEKQVIIRATIIFEIANVLTNRNTFLFGIIPKIIVISHRIYVMFNTILNGAINSKTPMS